jgi:hypothetical protein
MQKIMRHNAGRLMGVILLIYVRSIIAPGRTACGAWSCRGCGAFGFKFVCCSLNWRCGIKLLLECFPNQKASPPPSTVWLVEADLRSVRRRIAFLPTWATVGSWPIWPFHFLSIYRWVMWLTREADWTITLSLIAVFTTPINSDGSRGRLPLPIFALGFRFLLSFNFCFRCACSAHVWFASSLLHVPHLPLFHPSLVWWLRARSSKLP